MGITTTPSAPAISFCQKEPVCSEDGTIVIQDPAPSLPDEALRYDADSDTVVLIQDKLPVDPNEPEYLTPDQELLLVDAGPVFKGEDGRDAYEVWQADHPFGSKDDFWEFLRGPPGPPAESFEFEQVFASDLWTIMHNLNRYPSVTLVDSFGDKFEADVRYLNEKTVTVVMIAPCAGKAYLN